MKKFFLGCYNPSVILTYVGVLLSLLGIFFVSNIKIAILLLIGAAVCDLFDGVVARKIKRDEEGKAFGIQIDSLADMVSFGAFPFVILLAFTNYHPVAMVVGGLYVLAALIRLAWFNVHTDGKTEYYSGVPVTYIGLFVPVYYIITLIVPNPIHMYIMMGIYLIFAFLFIANIKVKKPRGVWYGIFSLMAIGSIIAILVLS